MPIAEETVALVALLRLNRGPPSRLSDDVEAAGSAQAVLDRVLSAQAARPDAAPQLFDPDPPRALDAAQLLSDAERDLTAWQTEGLVVLTVLDPRYPPNLRTVHDRPPLLFMRGREDVPAIERAIAVIGARRPSAAGLQLAGDISTRLAALEYMVVSGLASGIDTAAHVAALAAGAPTVAVLGTGLSHAYPPQNAGLQRTIAQRGTLLSQFWPDTPPRREQFPLRNAVMSGLTRATLIVEAGPRSGTRIQARAALAQGRPVLLLRSLIAQEWAAELAARPNVHLVAGADEAVAILERLHHQGPLTA